MALQGSNAIVPSVAGVPSVPFPNTNKKTQLVQTSWGPKSFHRHSAKLVIALVLRFGCGTDQLQNAFLNFQPDRGAAVN